MIQIDKDYVVFFGFGGKRWIQKNATLFIENLEPQLIAAIRELLSYLPSRERAT
jgi:hypothetical protein